MCELQGCGKIPSFGVAGTKMAEYCTQHAPNGMVNVMKKMCRFQGCGKIRAFGVAGTQMVEFCVKHAPYRMVNVYRRRVINPNNSGKKAIGDSSPSGSKHKTANSPPAQANPLSGGSRGSRKRIGSQHIMPTALKRSVVPEAAAGEVTMNRVATKVRTYFEMRTDGQRFFV